MSHRAMAPEQVPLPNDETQLAEMPSGQHHCTGNVGLRPFIPPNATGAAVNEEFKPYQDLKRFVQGDGWRYVPDLQLHHVTCLPDGFVALSTVYGTPFTIDVLDLEGHVTFRSEVDVGVRSSSTWVVGMENVQVKDGLLELDLAYTLSAPRLPQSSGACQAQRIESRSPWIQLRPPTSARAGTRSAGRTLAGVWQGRPLRATDDAAPRAPSPVCEHRRGRSSMSASGR